MQDDIVYHILKFAKENNGIFKVSSFKYIADPPKTWYEKQLLMESLVSRGYFDKYRGDGSHIFLYRLTLLGREVLEL